MKPKGWLRRLSRICVAKPLNSVGVKRDQLSTARLTLGLLAALALGLGPTYFWVAALLFSIGFFLERAGGELAQLNEHAGPAGDRYARVSDGASNALAFAGLGIGMRFGENGLAAILMGVFAGVALVVLSWLVRLLAAVDGKRSVEFDGVAGLDADDILLLFPIALLAGWQEGLLVVAAFALPTFALAFFMTHHRKITSD